MHGHMNVKFACETWAKKFAEVFKKCSGVLEAVVVSVERVFVFRMLLTQYKISVGVMNNRQSSYCVLQ